MATFESIASLNGSGIGDGPGAGVYIDGDGNIYGTAFSGGVSLGNGTSGGTVYKIAYDSQTQTYGAPQAIVAFAGGADGRQPNGTLIGDGQGNILGTTQNGGTDNLGTVFKLTYNSGTNTYDKEILATFSSGQTATSPGGGPTGNLYQDGAGNLYGTTVTAGPNNAGTVYKLAYDSGSGTYSGPTLVTTFDGSTSGNPGVSGSRLNDDLVADAAGNLYGTTQRGGVNGGEFDGGTVFKIAYDSVNGTYAATPQVLTSFGNGTGDPQGATGRLAVDAAGNIYGTTQVGGAADAGTVFKIAYNSTTLTYSPRVTIAEFTGGADGSNPAGGLIVDAAGNLYGTTQYSGGGDGTVFKISYDPSNGGTYGPIETLHSFNGTDGSVPAYATLVADSQGRLYGTTIAGGNGSNNGTVYRISDVGYSTVCYCRGTAILTEAGERPVEDLRIGDTVVTVAGRHRPIKWIGTRGYIGRFANANPGILPVCFRAGSLEDGIPARDLWVSPKHAMFLDGVLIPAECLVNGVTITKARRVESLTYFHVELDSHDVLIAEGAAAESFVDDNGRGIFHNAHAFHALYPDEARTEAVYCAPRVESGYVLEAVRRRLDERAGLSVPAGPIFGALRGHLDLCDGLTVHGWAQDLLYPDAPVCLDVLVDGVVVALAYAETYRPDLAAAGIGDGCHAFVARLPAPLAPDRAHTVSLRRSADLAALGRPLQVAAALPAAA